MKYIIFLILINLNCYSQNSIDSSLILCDSMDVRECGIYREFKKNKLEKNKLKRDIEFVKKLDKFLFNTSDTIFEVKKNKKGKFSRQKLNSILFKEESFNLNYFEIILFQIISDSVIYKGAVIYHSNTLVCNGDTVSHSFDSRIAKLIIKNLKSNYNFLFCGSFFVNYYNDYRAYDKYKYGIYDLKIPTKIKNNLIDCGKTLAAILELNADK